VAAEVAGRGLGHEVLALGLGGRVGGHVGALVAAEVGELGVGLVADLADEGLDAAVDVHVLLEAGRGAELLAALGARVVRVVEVHVGVQRAVAGVHGRVGGARVHVGRTVRFPLAVGSRVCHFLVARRLLLDSHGHRLVFTEVLSHVVLMFD